MPVGRKRLTKKKLQLLKALFNEDGDFLSADIADDIYRVQSQIGKYRTLEREEIERRKRELGMHHNISKQDLKKERRESQKKQSKGKKSLQALKKFMNKYMNLVFNSQFTFHFDGIQMWVIDTQKSIEQEHLFLYIQSNNCLRPGSLLSKWLDVFKQEDRFATDINFKRNFIATTPPRVGKWVSPGQDLADEQNNYGRADYNLMEGGFVDVPEATYKKFDMIPAMLCRNEFVFTQEAVRGAGGPGGYRAGGSFLSLLNDYYEKEAKKYPHVR